MPDGTSIFGVEVWGTGAFESKPMFLAREGAADVEYSFGTLFPPEGSPGWGRTPPDTQRRLLHDISVLVNGKAALELQRDTPEMRDPQVYFGANPVGGSVVAGSFSGRILGTRRGPVGQ
jgi:hypothetical protein